MPALATPETGREVALYGTFGQGVCLTDGRHTLYKSPLPGADAPNVYSTYLAKAFLVDNQTPERVDEMPRQPVATGHFDPTVEYPLWCYPMPVDPRTHEDFLFDRTDDPSQATNLWSAAPAERDAMLALVKKTMHEEGTPMEQFRRLGLV